MDALLDSQQQRGNHICGSIEDLQGQLHQFLLSKSTNTRAEHATITLELRYNTVFYLTTETENARSDSADPAQSQAPPPQQQATRTVAASETIQNQPSDDPVLQKAVAKHIISKITRPAFDCRGSLSVAFSKTRRGVIVKYDHTLLHKTVGQLVELLAPAPAPVPVNSANTRTPKAKRPPPADGEEGSRRKRPRKKGKAPEDPLDSTPATDVQQLAQNPTEVGEASQSSAAQAGILIVPAAEAARRREMAIGLLTGKGIDPATLSPEQFNIFANQAPQLQEASLEMLARYGTINNRHSHNCRRGCALNYRDTYKEEAKQKEEI
ncbi:putative c6 finger domain-containing protein [Eutypa lata UCREL1]|uniref:Putative c6 finger domain-containing protein n=1 Tax=Eutypa lata (strain UCR-EL1) TaxID=1287681 RepID=M7T0U1_EUTLA|nr:putative c6 finger domain-containing protein [Eutypa lata UCREL1]